MIFLKKCPFLEASVRHVLKPKAQNIKVSEFI